MAGLRLPIPDGMTKEEIDSMTVNDGEWRLSEEFACTCGLPAYYHPYTNDIWGCKGCGFTTYSVAVYFRPKQGGVRPKYPPGTLHRDSEFGEIKVG